MNRFFSLFIIVFCNHVSDAQLIDPVQKTGAIDFFEVFSDFKKISNKEKMNRIIELVTLAQRMPDIPKKFSAIAESTSKKLGKFDALILSLQEIELLEIVDFDFSNVPQVHASPPLNSGIDTGTDPSEIKDEAVRDQYKAAILENTLRTEIYNNQFLLKKKKTSLINSIRIFINNRQTQDEKDECLNTLKTVRLTGATKEILLSR